MRAEPDELERYRRQNQELTAELKIRDQTICELQGRLAEEEEENDGALQLYSALSVATLALELIAEEGLPAAPTAVQTIRMLRRRYPVCRELLKPEAE